VTAFTAVAPPPTRATLVTGSMAAGPHTGHGERVRLA
jgi:hypothetical protein